MERLIFIVLLLCVAQATLVQAFNCNTDAGKLGFLRNGSRSDPHCFNPVIDEIFLGVPPGASDLNFVSTKYSIAKNNALVLLYCIGVPTKVCRNGCGFLSVHDTMQRKRDQSGKCLFLTGPSLRLREWRRP